MVATDDSDASSCGTTSAIKRQLYLTIPNENASVEEATGQTASWKAKG
jgi:hypothetical protein